MLENKSKSLYSRFKVSVIVYNNSKNKKMNLKVTIIGILIGIILLSYNSYGIALADPPHCDREGFPSCYDVGFGDGQADPGTSCPGGHSARFCEGWDAGANSGGRSPTSTSSYWTLNVNLVQTNFDTSQFSTISVGVDLTGPFGYHLGTEIPLGSSPSVTFTVPSNQVPDGSQYKLCVNTVVTFNTILPNVGPSTCKFFVHNSGDETQTMDIPL